MKLKDWCIFILLLMPTQTDADDIVHLYAAGSLRDALDETARAFESASGAKVETKYGPSGILKDQIAAGAQADVFASANMEHPRALAQAGKSGPSVLFARNRLCALVRPGLAVDSATCSSVCSIRPSSSAPRPPKSDPSGDYAWEVFRKSETMKPGAFAALAGKAQQLMGGPSSPPAPANRVIYG